MRLDHLLSKDWICAGVASWPFDLARAVWVWAGRGCLLSRKAGRLTVVHWCSGWLACLVLGVGDTPAAACWVVVGAPACVGVACCRGSGAVRPGCLTRVLLPCVGGGSRVWVGWL